MREGARSEKEREARRSDKREGARSEKEREARRRRREKKRGARRRRNERKRGARRSEKREARSEKVTPIKWLWGGLDSVDPVDGSTWSQITA